MNTRFLTLAVLLLLSAVARGQVVFTLNPANASQFTSVLSSWVQPPATGTVAGTTAGFEAVVPQVTSTGTALNFNYGGTMTYVSATAAEITSNWALGSGTTPTDFRSLLGDRWQMTWTANNSASTATDRFNIYIDDNEIGLGQDNYELGFMVASANGAAAAQGVKFVANAVKSGAINDQAAAPLNGSVSRSYRIVVDELANTYQALVDNGAGFYAVSSGATAFDNAEREIYIQVRDRNLTGTAPNVLNEIATLTSLVIEQVPPAPAIMVDRATGIITMNNPFPVSLNVVGYSINSAGGAVKASPGGWTPIAGRLDQVGNGSFDPNGAWTVSANTTASVAEGVTSGDGGQLASSASVALGSVWRANPIEDIAFSYQLEGGALLPGIVTYTGSALLGDFDEDGALDKDDFVILSQNSYKELTTETLVSAYFKGDLDKDKDNDFSDFARFKQLYVAANGPAAFAALTVSVPEPAAIVCLVLAWGFGGVVSRR